MAALDNGNLKSPADCIDVLPENVDGNVAGLLNRCDTRLGDPDAPSEFSLGKPSLLAQSGEASSKAQLILDLGHPSGGSPSLENLLLPGLHTHRLPLLFWFPFVAFLVAALSFAWCSSKRASAIGID